MDTPGMRPEDFQTLLQRLLRVARLDATAFLEVRGEAAATVPAVIVVAVASILSAVGGWLLYLSAAPVFSVPKEVSQFLPAGIGRDSGRFFIHSVIVGSITEIVLWFVWVAITAAMLQQIWRRRTDFLALVRTMGLAFFPVGLSLFILVEPLALPIGIISLAAAVLLTGVAVEAATEAEPAEVLFSNLVGFALFAIVLGLLGRSGGWYAPGLFAFTPRWF